MFSQSHFSSKGLNSAVRSARKCKWRVGVRARLVLYYCFLNNNTAPESKMHKRQSQHGKTACDEEAIINLHWFVQEGGRSQQASAQSSLLVQMGDSIKCSNKYQAGGRMAAHNKITGGRKEKIKKERHVVHPLIRRGILIVFVKVNL